MTDAIVVLNVGSSSIKFALYQADSLALLLRGLLSGISTASCDFKILYSAVENTDTVASIPDEPHDHAQAIRFIVQTLTAPDQPWKLVAAGHRVVHGGANRKHPVIVDDDIMLELGRLEPLAPQHQPHNLAAIREIAKCYAELPQVACFDTAFHVTQDAVQRLLPLPESLREQGLIRYGFHGLSYEYLVNSMTQYTQQALPEKLIIAHLGNGASVCAIEQGQSKATTMGFSTLDGLIMATRCGSIDAGVLLHLLSQGMPLQELSDCLYQQSGLLGLSGISSDIRDLQNSESAQAKLALDAYINSLVKHVASLAAVMQGVDAIVFSGGVGENSCFVRDQLLTKLQWIGCQLDQQKNNRGDVCITTAQSRIQAYVIPTNEELIIAQHTRALCYH